jgi:hypothetical protein
MGNQYDWQSASMAWLYPGESGDAAARTTLQRVVANRAPVGEAAGSDGSVSDIVVHAKRKESVSSEAL